MEPRLLLIDDDPAVRDLAALVLGEAGFAVDVAADVAVPETVPWDRYHVVVLDIGLPSIDGIELCRGIRRRSAVPVLMLTGRDGNDDVVAGLDAGADDYVTKPFAAEVLVARRERRRGDRSPARAASASWSATSWSTSVLGGPSGAGSSST